MQRRGADHRASGSGTIYQFIMYINLGSEPRDFAIQIGGGFCFVRDESWQTMK
jgi:hypothetical protein